jgi:hypothetical protein
MRKRGVGLGLVAIVIGGCVFLLFWKHLSFGLAPKIVPRCERWSVAVIVAAVAINSMIALAPSTKIDELYYHMLIRERIREDGGFHHYRWACEAAFFPQTGLQL